MRARDMRLADWLMVAICAALAVAVVWYAGRPATASPSQARFTQLDVQLRHSTRVPLQVEQLGNGKAMRIIAKGTPALEVYSDGSIVMRDTVVLPYGAGVVSGTAVTISGFATMTPTPTSTPTPTPTATSTPTSTNTPVPPTATP